MHPGVDKIAFTGDGDLLRGHSTPPEETILRIEREFDVPLPADYRTCLAEAGGGDTLAPESYTGPWSAAALPVFNRRYRIPWIFPGLLGIGNDGFLVTVIDTRARPFTVASVGLSSSAWEDVVTEADSFSEWLERRLPPP